MAAMPEDQFVLVVGVTLNFAYRNGLKLPISLDHAFEPQQPRIVSGQAARGARDLGAMADPFRIEGDDNAARYAFCLEFLNTRGVAPSQLRPDSSHIGAGLKLFWRRQRRG